MDDPRVPRRWNRILQEPDEHEILFSVVSIWEIAIKRSLGKLRIEGATQDFARTLVTEHGFRQIPVELNEVCRIEKLPDAHRDPFDRLLIAQAIELGATAVTDDSHWHEYPVRVKF